MATYKFYKLSFAGSRKSAKPRTLKTLRSTIKALFGSQLMEEDLDRLLEHLTRRGVIKIADGKVQYELPA